MTIRWSWIDLAFVKYQKHGGQKTLEFVIFNSSSCFYKKKKKQAFCFFVFAVQDNFKLCCSIKIDRIILTIIYGKILCRLASLQLQSWSRLPCWQPCLWGHCFTMNHQWQCDHSITGSLSEALFHCYLELKVSAPVITCLLLFAYLQVLSPHGLWIGNGR